MSARAKTIVDLAACWGLQICALLAANDAQAQSYLSPGYIMGEIRDGLGIVKPEPAPEFVVRGRPDPSTLDYVPLKAPPRGFHTESMTPAGRLQGEAGIIAELESARASNQARASASGVAAPKATAKVTVPVEEDPPPMKWNAWDAE